MKIVGEDKNIKVKINKNVLNSDNESGNIFTHNDLKIALQKEALNLEVESKEIKVEIEKKILVQVDGGRGPKGDDGADGASSVKKIFIASYSVNQFFGTWSVPTIIKNNTDLSFNVSHPQDIQGDFIITPSNTTNKYFIPTIYNTTKGTNDDFFIYYDNTLKLIKGVSSFITNVTVIIELIEIT